MKHLRGIRIITEQIELDDQRKLGYSIYGDPNGYPIIFFHGWPGTRLDVSLMRDEALTNKIKIIGIDRPGMAFSTFQRKRRISDWPKDVEALLDHLKINEFSILAFSTGGLYALECALQDLRGIKKIGLVSPVPYYKMDWSNSSLKILYKSARIFRFAPFILRLGYRIMNDISMYMYKKQPERVYQTDVNRLTGVERELWEQEKCRNWFLNEYLPDLASSSNKGVTYDLFILGRTLAAAEDDNESLNFKFPVFLWHGKNDDTVPHVSSLQLNKIITNSKLKIYPNEGHRIIYNHFSEIINELK